MPCAPLELATSECTRAASKCAPSARRSMPSGSAVFTSELAMRSCAFSFARHGRMTVKRATRPVASRIKPAANPAIFNRSGNRRIGGASIGPGAGYVQVFGLTCRRLFVNVRRPMPRDPATVDGDLVARVRAHTDASDDAEIRAALATLSAPEEKRLDRLLRSPPPGRFGPQAWADLARGTAPEVASARELSGYYALLAERDALAAMVPRAPRPRTASPARKAAPPAEPAPARATRRTGRITDRAQHLLGLFAYHRDAPLVARSLSLSLEALDAELEDLGIRRKAYRLTRQTDA